MYEKLFSGHAANIPDVLARPLELAMEAVLPFAQKLDPTDIGGWLACWRDVRGDSPAATPLTGLPFGHVPAEKMADYLFFANEKAQRLGGRPDDLSSWQSRDLSDPDPRKKRYGGAIRVHHGGILAFSGLAEHFDEIVVFLIAARLGLIDPEHARMIREVSQNPHWEKILRLEIDREIEWVRFR